MSLQIYCPISQCVSYGFVKLIRKCKGPQTWDVSYDFNSKPILLMRALEGHHQCAPSLLYSFLHFKAAVFSYNSAPKLSRSIINVVRSTRVRFFHTHKCKDSDLHSDYIWFASCKSGKAMLMLQTSRRGRAAHLLIRRLVARLAPPVNVLKYPYARYWIPSCSPECERLIESTWTQTKNPCMNVCLYERRCIKE